MRTKLMLSLTVLAILLVAGVANMPPKHQAATQQPAATPPPPSKFKLTSSAYTEGSMIPTQYSCADPNAASPALSWSNPPSGAVSFAIIMQDTDAAPMKGAMDV